MVRFIRLILARFMLIYVVFFEISLYQLHTSAFAPRSPTQRVCRVRLSGGLPNVPSRSMGRLAKMLCWSISN